TSPPLPPFSFSLDISPPAPPPFPYTTLFRSCPAVARCDIRGNRNLERERHADADLLHRHGHLRAVRLRRLLLAVRLRPFAAEEPGVHPANPGVLGAAQRDPATDELAGEEPVAVQLHVDFGALAAGPEPDGLGERADARAVVEHVDLRRP